MVCALGDVLAGLRFGATVGLINERGPLVSTSHYVDRGVNIGGFFRTSFRHIKILVNKETAMRKSTRLHTSIVQPPTGPDVALRRVRYLAMQGLIHAADRNR